MSQRKLGRAISAVVLTLGLLVTAASPARSVLECRSPDGNRYFSYSCAPGDTKTSEKLLRSPGSSAATTSGSATHKTVTLYVVPSCDACDLVRNQLRERGVPFSLHDVSSDQAAQEAVQKLTKSTTVPILVIGSQVLTGYDRVALGQQLNEAGFPAAAGPAAAP